MPKRKRGGVTGDADRRRRRERQRERRQNEDENAAETRRRIDAERHRAVRAAENEEERERRHVQAAQHQREIREQETQEQHERRLTQDAQRHQEVREQETEDELERRLTQDAQRHQEVREQETEDEHERRLTQVAQHQQEVREQETEEQRERRLRQVAQHQQEVREQETQEQRQRRLSQVSQHQQAIREQETEEERNIRRAQDAEQHREVRAEESIEEREDRLRANRNRRPLGDLHNAARSANTVDVQVHTCGPMDNSCRYCSGLYFRDEQTTRRTYRHCCNGNKITEPERNFPPELRELFTGEHASSEEFFANVRSYNSVLSFASMGATVDLPPGSGPYCFRIHGGIYHRTSNLRPQQPGQERYAQLYILDSDQALRQRRNMISNVTLDEQLLRVLDQVIRAVNPYAEAYKMLKEFEEEELRRSGAQSTADIRMFIKSDDVSEAVHSRRYNAPVHNEVAAVFKSTDGAASSNRDIVIHPRAGRLIKVSTLNLNLEPMTYVLFFPHGEKGYIVGRAYTELMFYSHRVSVRRDCFNAVLYGRKLFQQYLVDAYAKVEGNRLSYLRDNQTDMRVETYMGLADHVYREAEDAGVTPGIPVILPSTFTGGPRYMQQNYQDAMAIVRQFGKPDLFLTFTCNPRWPEITENLFPGQKYYDRPDIVSRVFDVKKEALLQELTNRHILGKAVAHIHVIEFQKRGLPHMHLLLILAEEDKIRDPDVIDSLVCAELPDANIDPVLYSTVKSSMIHGPCGVLNLTSPCMVEGVCSKGYPKQFLENTLENVRGYPQYRRREDGKFVMVKGIQLDNRWVVPYNPYLSKKYNTHINLEVCSSIKSAAKKYLLVQALKRVEHARKE